jgi:hypothetical protein
VISGRDVVLPRSVEVSLDRMSTKGYVRWQDRQPRALPSLEGEWTHWWIEGDGCRLDIVPRDDPARAHRLVRENCDRMNRIFAYRARIDPASGEYIRDERRRHLITEQNL